MMYMKKILFLILCAALLNACDDGFREFKNTRSYASNTCNWERELRVTNVEFTDTATILTFFYKSRQPGSSMSILPQTYLCDVQDRHYKALFMTGHNLGEYFPSDPDGMSFRVGFEPMPRGTEIFDMIEGTGSNYFKIIGIHDSSYTPAKPRFSRSQMREADRLRRNIFRSGAVTLHGMVEGYDRSQNFQTYKLIYTDYITGGDGNLALEIDSDGRFETSFDVNNFIGAAIIDHKNEWHTFIAQPGDTLDMVFLEDGSVRYSLSDGRPYLLENYDRIPHGVYVMDNGRFSSEDSVEHSEVLDCVWEWRALGRDYINYLASRYSLTAFEYEFARIMTENRILESYLDYRMNVNDRIYPLLSSVASFEQIDTAKVREVTEDIHRILTDPEGIRFIAGFTADDSLMLVMPQEWVIFNRYKYDDAFYDTSGLNLDSLLDNSMSDGLQYAMREYLEDSVRLANDMRVYGSSEPTLFGKICVMQDIGNTLGSINTLLKFNKADNPDSVLLAYMAREKRLLNDANLEARADLIYQDFIRRREPYWELPDCRGTEVLKTILANYPGKYVYIDFWSTGCGPCIAGIKSLFNGNRKLMTGKYDKFAMVFITDDPEQAYEPFRKEWLEGAESYRVSRDDYNALSSLFNFSGIPHHEMITPDGRAVSEVPNMMLVNPDNPEGNAAASL